MIAEQDPSVYLVGEPSAAAKILTQQVNRHSGGETPFWMLAEVAIRQHTQGEWIGEMNGFFRKVRRYAIAGVLALLGNLGLIGGYAVHRIAATAAAEEHAANEERSAQERRDGVEREIQDLRLDIRELRAQMRRLSGADPINPPSSEVIDDPSKFSMLFESMPLLVSVGPPPPPPEPNTCGNTCSSNQECGFTSVCKFCSFASCSQTRPESPQPAPDAGVDAP